MAIYNKTKTRCKPVRAKQKVCGKIKPIDGGKKRRPVFKKEEAVV